METDDGKELVAVNVKSAENILGDLDDIKAFHSRMTYCGLHTKGLSLDTDSDYDLEYKGSLSVEQTLSLLDVILGIDNIDTANINIDHNTITLE